MKTFGEWSGRVCELSGFQGRIGFISAVSHKFCDSCNRIRLTAEGYLKLCLQYESGIDLRKLLRSGATDEELKEAMRQAIWKNRPVTISRMSEEMKKLVRKKNIGPCTELVARSVMK